MIIDRKKFTETIILNESLYRFGLVFNIIGIIKQRSCCFSFEETGRKGETNGRKRGEKTFSFRRAKIPNPIIWRKERKIFAKKASALFADLRKFRYRYMAFFSRSSGSGKGRHRERYKAFHVQINLWEAWLREVYFPFNEGETVTPCNLFLAQTWKARPAGESIGGLLRANADRRTLRNLSELIMSDRFEGRKFKVYYSDGSGHLKSTLNKVAMTDGAALFLVGATALTVDLASWRKLARAHRHNDTPTMVVTFETANSPLCLSDICRRQFGVDVGGGYTCFEFRLDKMGEYLDSKKRIPEPYRTLIQLWKDAKVARKGGRKNTARRAKGEGTGRNAVFRNETARLVGATALTVDLAS